MIKKDRLIDPQRLNLYCYTRNEPLNYLDPNGAHLVFAPILEMRTALDQVRGWRRGKEEGLYAKSYCTLLSY